MKVTKIKKTGQVVYQLGRVDSQHQLVLVVFDTITRKGNRGVVQTVRDDNLIEVE